MSVVLRVALAATLSLAFVSNTMAQNVRSNYSKLKPFTAEEKLYFDRASNPNTNGGGGGGGGGDSGGGGS